MQQVNHTLRILGERLRRLDEQRLLLPDGSLCDGCGKVMLGYPGVRERLERLGILGRGVAGGELGGVCCGCGAQGERRRTALLAASNLPKRRVKTLESFIERPGTEEALASVRAYCGQHPRGALTISGEVGSGKSHLLEGLSRELIEHGVTVRYEVVRDLRDRLLVLGTQGMESERQDALELCRLARVLVLDGAAWDGMRPREAEMVLGLVDYRLREDLPLVTSVRGGYRALVEDWKVGELASRLFDKASGSVAVAFLTCDDYRMEA